MRDAKRHNGGGAAARGGRRGFTLVEILVVVAIIGIAGAIVVPAMVRAGSLQVQAAGRMVIADLLYAQNEAIARQQPRRVTFDLAGNSYKLTDTAGAAIGVSWKNGSAANYVVDFKQDGRFSGVTITKADFGGSPTVEYDVLGGPSSGGTIELVSSDLQYRITVAPFTGRVTIAPFTAGGGG